MSENKQITPLNGDVCLLPSEKDPLPLGKTKSSPLSIHSLGQNTIDHIMDEYLDLLDSSAAVFEQNGSYAGCRTSSGWCQLLNDTSRESCGEKDESAAMVSGKWHCHESCWKASKTSMEKGEAVDIGCLGGIHIHAVPVVSRGSVIGSINFGYGDPPKTQRELKIISKRYGIELNKLKAVAQGYESRPSFIVDIVKKRLKVAAQLMGEIASRHESELEMKALIAHLNDKNKKLERFVYTISHDLKSPILTIRGFLDLLKKDLAEGAREQANDDIEVISKAAETMSRLVEDLLDLSRIGIQPKAYEEVSLEALAHEALNGVKGRVSVLNVKVQIASELPVIFAEKERIRQVLENLIDNAAKFMGDQVHPLIEIGMRIDGEEKIITIRDNGIGIEAGFLEKVFGVFNQLDPEKEGSGVGLAIVREIIETHQGRCWIESKGKGYGSTFCFCLPEIHSKSCCVTLAEKHEKKCCFSDGERIQIDE